MVFSPYVLSQIDPHKACGPDNIPAQVLQEMAQELIPMITHLLNSLWTLVYHQNGNLLMLHQYLRKIRDLIH